MTEGICAPLEDHTLDAALGRVKSPIATAATLPPACYTDAGVYEREPE